MTTERVRRTMVHMSGKAIAFAVGLVALLVAAASLAVAAGSEPGPSAEDIPAIATARPADASATLGAGIADPDIPDEDKPWEALSAFSEGDDEDEHEVVHPTVRDDDDEDADSDDADDKDGEHAEDSEDADKKVNEKKKRKDAPKTDDGD